LRFTIVQTSKGSRVEYDVDEWAHLCHHPGSDSVLACPSLKALLDSELGKNS